VGADPPENPAKPRNRQSILTTSGRDLSQSSVVKRSYFVSPPSHSRPVSRPTPKRTDAMSICGSVAYAKCGPESALSVS
jgi:hypothetical protein